MYLQETAIDDADTSADISEAVSASPVRQDSELTTGSADSIDDDGEMVIHPGVSNVSDATLQLSVHVDVRLKVESLLSFVATIILVLGSFCSLPDGAVTQ